MAMSYVISGLVPMIVARTTKSCGTSLTGQCSWVVPLMLSDRVPLEASSTREANAGALLSGPLYRS